jgi:hypothetical protein
MSHWDKHHPYRFRTWVRQYLPQAALNAGIAQKAANCETVGAAHWWYNKDDVSSGCYHCEVVRSGRLWEAPPN